MARVQDNRQARESLERVLRFVIAISKYTQQRSALNQALKAGAATKEMVLRAADRDFDLHNELTAILARYNFVATVDGPNALRFRGRFDADSFTSLPSVIYPDGFHEADAVLVVFQLTQQNYISNLRMCTQCHLRFFYSSKRNRKFCEDPCRFRFWNATHEAKEARRVAAKNRRDKERKYRKYWTKKKSQGRLKPKRRAQG